jgi:hypothetical protein
MTLPTVFVSYNPESDVEQTTAVRIHTIGAVSGFEMLLPDRGRPGRGVSLETIGRINMSDYFVLFSASPLSIIVQEEINLAFARWRDRSRIVVIYDNRVGRNLNAENCTEVYIDIHSDPQSIVSEITSKFKSVRRKDNSNFLVDLSALLLTGLGLFVLANVMEDALTEPKKQRSKKSKALRR